MFCSDFKSLARFSTDGMQKVSLFQSERMFADLYCLMPGQAQRIHVHAQNDKMYFVLEGTVICTCQDEEGTLVAGESSFPAANMAHGIRNESGGNAIVLVVMAPNSH